MCRALHEGGRRCPCSSPERRSAADRARYAAKKAAGLTAPGQTHPAPIAPAAPSVQDIQEKIDLLQRALDTTAPANSHENLDAYEQWRENYRQAGEELQEWTGAGDGLDAREQAVIKVGAMVAERAEMHAGITADEVQASWQARSQAAAEEFEAAKAIVGDVDAKLDAAMEERRAAYRELQDVERQFPPGSDAVQEARAFYDDCDQAYADTYRAREAAYTEANYYPRMWQLKQIEAGTDDQTREDLKRLSDGYRTALAEVRDLGGELRWHEKTTAKAKKFFEPAAQVYPSDWIAASNARALPVGKVTRSRAHYTDGAQHVTRKKTPVTDTFPISNLEQVKRNYTAPYYRHEVVTDASGKERVVVTYMERYSPYQHRMKNGKPTGAGWEQVTYENRHGDQETVWWRPQTRMREVDSTFAPEITTNGSSETSMHELAHRMEASIPQIGEMEARWVTRRTTTNGVRDQPEAYSPRHRRERVRPDDFIDRYIGKDYNTGRYHEVLSVGAPMLFLGDRGGMAGVARHKRDDDMRAFVLGAMASAKPATRRA